MTRIIAALIAAIALLGITGSAAAQDIYDCFPQRIMPLADTSTGKLMLIPTAMSIAAGMLLMLPLNRHRRLQTKILSAVIMAAATIAYLPITYDLIAEAKLWSPNAGKLWSPNPAGDAEIARQALVIACLPILLGWALTVWSMRTRHAGISLALACTASAGIAMLTFKYHIVVDLSRS